MPTYSPTLVKIGLWTMSGERDGKRLCIYMINPHKYSTVCTKGWRLQPTRAWDLPPMFSRHGNLEPLGRWHATTFNTVMCNVLDRLQQVQVMELLKFFGGRRRIRRLPMCSWFSQREARRALMVLRSEMTWKSTEKKWTSRMQGKLAKKR